ncbi:IQ domain-containing protein K [Octopus bimaculoides]|uniref:IQ domain-containing protein K n=1 Tax=Octopus bimaculoides TaxID=37653 RepID=UPI00071E2995|nr:IQ domain-containing protein K [Octopus bimaculoides]|eukprot:XP_014788355.1 PREDICTED: IQ domain-containing protein K-like [Octopus bimaculoides]
MAKIVEIAEEHLWDSICGESDEPFPICSKDDVLHEDYDPALHHPVFCGYLCAKVDTYEDAAADFDPATSHPACVGYVLIDIPKKHVKPKCDEAPDPKTCEPSEYLQYYIFPLLVPALTEVLRQAKLENCFVRKKTKFNCADFLTEYLYKNNPNYNDRQDITLWDIPFVKEWLKDHEKFFDYLISTPLLSLFSVTSMLIALLNSHTPLRLVRCQPEIQELRRWQWDWKEENRGIRLQVNEFWNKKMPNYHPGTESEENISSSSIQ